MATQDEFNTLMEQCTGWKLRALEAEAKLAEAVLLMEELLGLERGSGEEALAFIERHSSPLRQGEPR